MIDTFTWVRGRSGWLVRGPTGRSGYHARVKKRFGRGYSRVILAAETWTGAFGTSIYEIQRGEMTCAGREA